MAAVERASPAVRTPAPPRPRPRAATRRGGAAVARSRSARRSCADHHRPSSKVSPIPSTHRASRHSSIPARLPLTTSFAPRLPRALLCWWYSQESRIPETSERFCAPPPPLAPPERLPPLRASAAQPAPFRQKHSALLREPPFIFQFLPGPLLRSFSLNSRWREFARLLQARTSLATESSRFSLPGKSIGANLWHCSSATRVPGFPKKSSAAPTHAFASPWPVASNRSTPRLQPPFFSTKRPAKETRCRHRTSNHLPCRVRQINREPLLSSS